MKKSLLSLFVLVGLGAGAAFAQGSVVTANNDTVVVAANDSIKIAVLANDDDQSGGASLAIVDSALNGSVRIDGDTILYTPNMDFTGVDSFVYRLRAIGPLPLPGTTDDATVYITVTGGAGIRRIEIAKGAVAPNPMNDFTIISFDNAANVAVNLTVLDITGKVVANETTNASSFRFDRNGLAAGTYLYTVKSATAVVAAGKIAIK